jgi:hypothetical protein
MSIEIERVDSTVKILDYEINRLAGTLVNGLPTLGPATAALKWLGHHDGLAWAHSNLCTPNQATGGMAEESTAGFLPLDGQTLAVVEGDPIIGNLMLQVTSVEQAAPEPAATDTEGKVVMQDSRILFEDPFPVEPWSIYTCSLYTRMEPNAITPSRANWVTLHWFDAEDQKISEFEGDFHVSKPEWNLTWVTSHAPENAATCRVTIRWEQMPGEVFSIDKAQFYNGTDPQAWAYPEAGSTDRQAGLRAHLSMKAGIFNPERFLSPVEAGNRVARLSGTDLALALSTIPTPNPNEVPH